MDVVKQEPWAGIIGVSILVRAILEYKATCLFLIFDFLGCLLTRLSRTPVPQIPHFTVYVRSCKESSKKWLPFSSQMQCHTSCRP